MHNKFGLCISSAVQSITWLWPGRVSLSVIWLWYFRIVTCVAGSLSTRHDSSKVIWDSHLQLAKNFSLLFIYRNSNTDIGAQERYISKRCQILISKNHLQVILFKKVTIATKVKNIPPTTVCKYEIWQYCITIMAASMDCMHVANQQVFGYNFKMKHGINYHSIQGKSLQLQGKTDVIARVLLKMEANSSPFLALKI